MPYNSFHARQALLATPSCLARALREGESKKFSRLQNFRELRPEFPGTDGERQTLPERENQKENINETKS
jgi:hypothetical protein